MRPIGIKLIIVKLRWTLMAYREPNPSPGAGYHGPEVVRGVGAAGTAGPPPAEWIQGLMVRYCGLVNHATQPVVPLT